MTTLLFVWLLAHGVPGPHAEALAPCIADSPEPYVLLGVMHVESRYESGKRSGAGACSYFGLLGGRYGHSPCPVLEVHPEVACREAIQELARWKDACGDSYLDAYNGGWWKCWARENVKGRRCWGRCDSYTQAVMRHAEWARSVLDAMR